jgi:hypothetical protein
MRKRRLQRSVPVAKSDLIESRFEAARFVAGYAWRLRLACSTATCQPLLVLLDSLCSSGTA